MSKRSYHEGYRDRGYDLSNGYGQPPYKKQKDHHHHPGARDYSANSQRHQTLRSSGPYIPYDEAVKQLPSANSTLADVPAYSYSEQHSSSWPELPPLTQEPLASAPFKHRSAHSSNRSIAANDVSYERLEFLGDAYLELFASRLIYARFQHLPAGQMSQLRELLVKNETLAEYAKAYGFDRRVEVADLERMKADAHKGNKGLNKVLGDVFEAYIAAVVLSDSAKGFSTAEEWVTNLWAPKLVDAAKHDRLMSMPTDIASGVADPLKTYDPEARPLLQKRILGGSDVKLSYEQDKPMRELKGDKLGQNLWSMALYLTGFGYERRLVGRGEGKNKSEAGNWAAIDAMYGMGKAIVDECEVRMSQRKEEKKKANAAAAAATAASEKTTEPKKEDDKVKSEA